MEIYSRLYVGESVNNLNKVIKKLEKGSPLVRAYVITLAENKHDQLEIYDAKVFVQKHFRYRRFCIVGIAGDYEEAVGLIVKITGECAAARGDYNLKAYLTETDRRGQEGVPEAWEEAAER